MDDAMGGMSQKTRDHLVTIKFDRLHRLSEHVDICCKWDGKLLGHVFRCQHTDRRVLIALTAVWMIAVDGRQAI